MEGGRRAATRLAYHPSQSQSAKPVRGHRKLHRDDLLHDPRSFGSECGAGYRYPTYLYLRWLQLLPVCCQLNNALGFHACLMHCAPFTTADPINGDGWIMWYFTFYKVLPKVVSAA